jgi:simple sugar transport system permease protein
MLIALVGGGLLIIGFVAYPLLHQFRDLNTLVRVSFFDLLNGQLDFIQNANARMGIVWWALLALIFTVLLRYTRYGNAVFATGGNAGAARAQGVPVDTIRIVNFVISGGLCAVAGVIAVGRELSVFPLEAQGLELEVIAATVIGGALLSGGYGSVIGAVLGVLITGMLRTGLVLLRVPAELFQGATGVILIIAVILNTSVRGGNTLFSLERFRRRPAPAAPIAQAAPNVKEKA